MDNKRLLGPQRTAAAVLLLWGVCYSLVDMGLTHRAYGSALIFILIPMACAVALAALLLAGKKNVGFAVVFGIQLILSVRSMILGFSLPRLAYLASDLLMLAISLLAFITAASGKRHPLRNLEFIPVICELLPYFLTLLEGGGYAVYYINAVINAFAVWLTARALTYTSQAAASAAPEKAAVQAAAPVGAAPAAVPDAGQAGAAAAWKPVNPRLASNMPLRSLIRAFVFTDGDGSTVFSSPVAAGTLSDTVGAPAQQLSGRFPMDVIARSQVGRTIAQTGQFPQEGWLAMSAIDAESVRRAQLGELRTCVRTFSDPTTAETGAFVLLYEL